MGDAVENPFGWSIALFDLCPQETLGKMSGCWLLREVHLENRACARCTASAYVNLSGAPADPQIRKRRRIEHAAVVCLGLEA